MKTFNVHIFSALAFLVLLTGCNQKPKDFYYMTEEEKLNHMRSQSEFAMKDACTNEVPGIRNFVDLRCVQSSRNITNWKAQVEFDYVNHFGGIDRTNIHLIFGTDSLGRLYSLPDFDYYQKQWKAEQARILSNRN